MLLEEEKSGALYVLSDVRKYPQEVYPEPETEAIHNPPACASKSVIFHHKPLLEHRIAICSPKKRRRTTHVVVSDDESGTYLSITKFVF